jgi:galactose-1-phosphate uridylyltransferase
MKMAIMTVMSSNRDEKHLLVGYEMLGMPQRDITPEASAQWLRNLSSCHYLDRDLQPPRAE